MNEYDSKLLKGAAKELRNYAQDAERAYNHLVGKEWTDPIVIDVLGSRMERCRTLADELERIADAAYYSREIS